MRNIILVLFIAIMAIPSVSRAQDEAKIKDLLSGFKIFSNSSFDSLRNVLVQRSELSSLFFSGKNEETSTQTADYIAKLKSEFENGLSMNMFFPPTLVDSLTVNGSHLYVCYKMKISAEGVKKIGKEEFIVRKKEFFFEIDYDTQKKTAKLLSVKKERPINKPSVLKVGVVVPKVVEDKDKFTININSNQPIKLTEVKIGDKTIPQNDVFKKNWTVESSMPETTKSGQIKYAIKYQAEDFRLVEEGKIGSFEYKTKPGANANTNANATKFPITFDFTAGIGLGAIQNDLAQVNYSSSNALGFSLMAQGTYWFNPNFGVSLGAGISRYSSTVTIASDSLNFSDTDADNTSYRRIVNLKQIVETQNIMTFDIPIVLKYSSISDKDNNGFFGDVGLLVSIPVVKQYTATGGALYRGYYQDFNVLLSDIPDYKFGSNNISSSSTLNVGLSYSAYLSVGWIRKIDEKKFLKIGVYTIYGLNNISQNPNTSMPTSNSDGDYNSLLHLSNKTNLMLLGLNVGYSFSF